MHFGAAQLFRRDLFAGRRFHERRAAEEDRALTLHDDRLVRHRRDVGAAGGARAHHARDLRDAVGRHVRLVVEDAAEVVAVGEDVLPPRQVGAARVDEIEARQAVLPCDFLGADVLLHRHRVVSAALHRRVVGDDQALLSRHAADPGDDPGGRGLVVVHVERRELRQLEKRRTWVEQLAHALARQELAPPGVFRPRRLIAPERDLPHLVAQVLHERGHRRRVRAELFGAGVQCGLEDGHARRRREQRRF